MRWKYYTTLQPGSGLRVRASHQTQRKRTRAVALTCGALLIIFLILYLSTRNLTVPLKGRHQTTAERVEAENPPGEHSQSGKRDAVEHGMVQHLVDDDGRSESTFTRDASPHIPEDPAVVREVQQAILQSQESGCDWEREIIPSLLLDKSAVQPDQPWLTFIIPTVPRQAPYLSETLAEIASQVPSETKFVKVVVVHNTKENNPVHHVLRKEKAERSQDGRFVFIETTNPLPIVNGDPVGNADLPGPRVRAQTRDLVNAIRTAIKHFKQVPKYVLLMEDDFRLCHDAFKTFVYMIRRLSNQWDPMGGWMLVRFSFGFNGVILHGEDALLLADYLQEHQARRPPDHLLVEWFAGERPQSAGMKRGRPHAAYKYNLLDHLGVQSTLRDGKQPEYVRCWRPLEFPVNFEVEVFKKECSNRNPDEDVWPCPTEATSRCPPWPRHLSPA